MRMKSFPNTPAWFPATALLGIAFAFCLPVGAQSDDPPPQAGRLSALTGDVVIQPANTDSWGQAYPNLPLGPGDRIITQDYGRAEIQIGRTWVRIGHNADVTLVDANADAITFGIASGSVRVHCNGLWDDQTLYVQTPSGSTTVSGPADFRVDSFPDQASAIFTDNYGPVYISGAGDFGVETGPGQALQLVGSNPVYPQWLEPAYPDDLDNWSMGRDAQIARAVSYRYVSPEIAGAYELDAAGDWMPESDYGPVWFPHVAPGWAPYRNGHWINRPPWGWVWVEEEPWGDAPFHYGRWVVINGRWGWIPGPAAVHPVWSPALVVFAGGGPGVSVWFPLGPGEPYRPWYHCSPRYVDQVNISNIRPAPRVVVQRTYVNIVNVNVTNITYVNRTAGYTAVRQEDFAAGRPVAHVAVNVNVNMIEHPQVMAAPPVEASRAAVIAPPPAHVVHVSVARPVLINAQGKAVAAQPHAQPAPPPVRPVAAPKPMPGRKVVAQPATVKVIPPSQHLTASGKPAAAPPTKPAPAAAPNPAPAAPPKPTPATTSQPGPAPRPGTAPPSAAQPKPAPSGKPAAPEAKPAPAPAPKTAASTAPQPSPAAPKPAPGAAPKTAPAPAPKPEAKPAPAPTQKPQASPAPQTPAPKPQASPAPQTPAPKPQATPPPNKPQAKPAPKPDQNQKPKDQKPDQKPD